LFFFLGGAEKVTGGGGGGVDDVGLTGALTPSKISALAFSPFDFSFWII
jgi:hypothetical protein